MMKRLLTTTALASMLVLLTSASGVAQAGQSRGAAPAPAKSSPVAPVNLNTATAVELQALPGVGPALAARIVEYREKNGGLKKVEDLMNVRGIGEKSFLTLRPLVTVAAPAPQKTER